ncbi:hypothetical protein SynA1524_00439 [Synechococcus sp. A15-24]|nr:hypothetical protein SynA1524_00439 [Synechococcus sp. A15-24]
MTTVFCKTDYLLILLKAKLYVSQIRVLVTKRQLPIQADLIVNRLPQDLII